MAFIRLEVYDLVSHVRRIRDTKSILYSSSRISFPMTNAVPFLLSQVLVWTRLVDGLFGACWRLTLGRAGLAYTDYICFLIACWS